MWRVDVATDPGLTVGRATELFRGDWSVTGPNRNYDVAADGRRFLMCRSLTESPEPVTDIHLTLNWFDELERLVPTE